MLRGKRVLVTGGTGSFAHAFVERAIQEDPDRLVIFSRDEQKQDAMQREFSHPSLRWFIGDVRDQSRLEMAMRGIEIVVHAAALKIIPSCEYNPFEAVSTNVHGAENVIRSSIRAGVGRIVALSTDKACQPLNLYGATKLAAEKLFAAARNVVGGGSPLFTVVRYGNVVGSRGSVVPLYRALIAENKPLPITDTLMTRFWITLEQAVDLVYLALEKGQGSDVIIPKIPSMNIVELAKAMGGDDYPIEIVGIRPGEKIYETLMTEDESRMSAEGASVFVLHPDYQNAMPAHSYNSRDNHQWLTREQLRAMI